MGRRGAGLVLAVCLGTGAARADRPDVAGLRAALEAGDGAAAAKLAAVKGAGEEALLDALALGLPPAVAATALDAAATVPKAEPVLVAYARARDATVRAHAVAALGAGPAVLAALGDLDPAVRTAAATALAARHDARAVAPLLALLKRGDAVAIAPLAALANAGVARQVTELAGQVPDSLLAQTLGAMLLRKDLGPDPIYSALARTLGALPGTAALDALGKYVAAAPAGRASRREAADLLKERGR